MSNVTLLHWLGRGLPGHCPFYIIGQFSLVCTIIMTFDLDLFITINLRNKFLRSELYGNVVLGDLCTSIGLKLTCGISPYC